MLSIADSSGVSGALHILELSLVCVRMSDLLVFKSVLYLACFSCISVIC